MIRPPPRSPLFPSTTLFRSTGSPRPAPPPPPDPPAAAARSETPSSPPHPTPPPPHPPRRPRRRGQARPVRRRSEEHTSELQSRQYLVCRLLLEKKKE